MTPTDADDIRASLADPARFAAVFDRHGGAVAGYLGHRAPPSAVEDLVSETFLSAFRSRDRYDLGQADARPWLLGIATNTLRHHWRAEGRRRALSERLRRYGRWTPDRDDHSAGRTGPWWVDDGDRPRVLAALDRIDPGTRDALMLLAVGELTYDEIAVALGIPVGTVRSRIFRGRRRLRELLGGELLGGEASGGEVSVGERREAARPIKPADVGPKGRSTLGPREECHG